MNRLLRRRFQFFVPLLALALCLGHRALAEDSAPWLQPGNADKFIFVGASVWDVETGKVVSPTGTPKGLAPEDASLMIRRVPGVSDGLFMCPVDPHAPPGTGALGYVLQLDGSAQKAPAMPEGVVQNMNSSAPCFWTSTDHRRVIWIQGGDYWRGEVDWANYKIINPKQVTTLGVFNAGHSPMLWWGQLLFVYGNFDKEKPIVRINLASGETDELEKYRAMEVNVANRAFMGPVSPNRCRTFYVSESVIYSFDFRTAKPLWFHNKFEDSAGTRNRNLLMRETPVWGDDDTAYFLNNPACIVRLDLRNGRMEFVTRPDSLLGRAPGDYRLQSILPGGHFADVLYFTNGLDKSTMAGFKNRFVLEIATGKRTDIPLDDKAIGTWIDESTYLYTRSQGGLSAIGTWVYDRNSNSNKRLIGMAVDTARMRYLKKQRQVWAVSQQSGSSLIRLNLDGPGSQNLGPCALAAVCQMPSESLDIAPIDTAELWKPAKVDEAALAATLPPEPPVGKLKLFGMMKDRSPEERKSAENSYDYAQSVENLSNYCDPIKWAMKRLADPKTPEFMVDLTDCFDRDRINESAQNQSMGYIINDAQLTAAQKQQIAEKTGPMVADAFLSSPKPDPRTMLDLVQKSTAKARAAVLGGAAASAEGAAPVGTPPEPQPAAQPEPQPEPQPNPQQADRSRQNNQPQNNQPPQQDPPKQPPPPAPSKADKNAQKAKEAAERLRRIIGR